MIYSARTKSEPARGRGPTRSKYGRNWITIQLRLAIYVRDGYTCAYCGATARGGTVLCLDHVLPYRLGGPHDPANLITTCIRCNKRKGGTVLAVWAARIRRIGATVERTRRLEEHVRARLREDLTPHIERVRAVRREHRTYRAAFVTLRDSTAPRRLPD